MALQKIQEELRKYSSKKQAKILQWFFKTGPGEYGEGDVFIGVKVPNIRIVAKKYQDIGFQDLLRLLKSKIHEERLTAILILVLQYSITVESERERLYKAYLKNTKYINNWDLVDLSAWHIVGAFLTNRAKNPLFKLAKSKSLWERRISIVSTYYFIKNNQFKDTLKIAQILITDKEDLIHKAVGWMLREVGKRDLSTEEKFLKKFYKKMPRTMLRYAIERFPEPKRMAYLKGVIR